MTILASLVTSFTGVITVYPISETPATTSIFQNLPCSPLPLYVLFFHRRGRARHVPLLLQLPAAFCR